MKKILTILVVAVLFISCKSTSIVNTKLDGKTERMLKGDWVITSVDYPGSDYLKVNSFNIEDAKCFIGSNWNFISNNNEGQMSLNNSTTSCKEFNSPIKWYINQNGEFVLKIINDHMAKKVNSGFVLSIKNVTETSFELVDKVNVASEIKNITYTFQRK